MKKIFFILLILETASKGFAQIISPLLRNEECGSKMKVKLNKLPPNFERNTTNTQPYCFKVYITVFADNDGTNVAMTNTEIETRKVFMVNAYSAHNVCFMFIGTQTINNTALNNFDIADDNDLNPYKYSNTLNIFIHKVLKDGDTRPRGNAYSIPNTEGYLSLGGNAGMPTMAHEMGHVFGLFHTFEPHPWDPLHGKESVERNSGNSCFDCDEDGDYVCDTPADPDQDEGGYMANNINASCIYTGNRSDECGMFYTPSTNNIMSYCPDGCRTTFTPGQASRFLTIIANQPDFEPRMAPDTKNVGSPFPIIDNGGFQNYYAKLLINVFGYYYAIGSSQVLMQAKKIVINNNTHLSPSTGKIVIRPFVGCN